MNKCSSRAAYKTIYISHLEDAIWMSIKKIIVIELLISMEATSEIMNYIEVVRLVHHKLIICIQLRISQFQFEPRNCEANTGFL